jgi:hypothetical protein
MRASRRHDAPECDKHERAAPLFCDWLPPDYGLWANIVCSLRANWRWRAETLSSVS